MRRMGVWGVAAVLWSVVGSAWAAAPSPEGPLRGKVGDWVTYRLVGENGHASFWRMALVSEARDNHGRDAVWLEMEIGETAELAAPLARMTMLVARNAADPHQAVTRLWIAVGFERPQEVSPEALGGYFLPPLPSLRPPPPGGDVQVRTVGRRPLRTSAGMIEAQLTEVLRRGVTVERLWTSDAVPVLGLARVELGGGRSSLEVHASGHDARPRMGLPGAGGPIGAPMGAPIIPLARYNGDLLSQVQHAGDVP